MARPKKSVQKNSNRVQDKIFWAALGIIFIISTVVIVTNVDTSIDLTGNAVVQTISYFKAGGEMILETKTGGIQDVTVTFNEEVKNSLIKTETVDDVSWNFDGKVYSKVKISSVIEDKINEGIKVTLKIRENDLLESGISQGDVRLFVNGEKLDTVFDKSKDGYLYYKAVSPSLGEFIIGKEMVKEVEVVNDVVPEPVVEVVDERVVEEEVVEEEAGFFASIGNFFKGLFN